MRRIFFALAAGMMAVWFLLAGCSGDHATAGASTTGTGGSSASSNTSSSASGMSLGAAAVQAYCDATARAYCEAFYACCPEPGKGFGAGTLEDCKRRYSDPADLCLWGAGVFYAGIIDAGETVLDQAKLDACVARFTSMSPDGGTCSEPLHLFYNLVCPAAFQGQVALGAHCIYGNGLWALHECVHGWCDKTTHTCQPLAQLGEPCGDVNGVWRDCEQGEELSCVHKPPPDGPSFCAHHGDLGDPCADGQECKSFSCDPTTGTCGLPSPNAPCY